MSEFAELQHDHECKRAPRAARAGPKAGTIIAGDIPNQLLKHWHKALKAAGAVEGGGGSSGFRQLLIEICCAEDSRLSEHVLHGCAVIRNS